MCQNIDLDKAFRENENNLVDEGERLSGGIVIRFLINLAESGIILSNILPPVNYDEFFLWQSLDARPWPPSSLSCLT